MQNVCINKRNQNYIKMKTRTLILLMTFAMLGTGLNAQFFKKVADRAAKAAEETVLRKVDEKTTQKTEKGMDTIFDSGQKKKRKKAPRQQEGKSNKQSEGNTPNNQRTVKSAKDFVPGNKVLYSDTFSNDAIGDFPVTWNTNSSAEVVTFEGDDTRWLQLANSGQFIPDGITDIPENSTLEFDLYVSDTYSFYSEGLYINMVEVGNRSKDFVRSTKLNGAHLWLHPVAAGGGPGRTYISNYINGEKIIENSKNFDKFTKSKNLVHVSIWRQKSRIRVYIDDNKIWDLPRAFGDDNYNALVFTTGRGKDDAYYYVANLRLAVAGEDKRHALLETGKFETNEILFDVGKASIQESSYSILDELGELLEVNSDFSIKIIGHTDADGAADSNQTLSELRAKSVKEYLTDNYAIKGNRLVPAGKGSSAPVASNDNAEGKRKNRRVEFVKM